MLDEPQYSSLPFQGEALQIGSYKLSASEVIKSLEEIITEERKQKIEQVINARSNDFIPVLEDIYDRGNTNAVMRSAEAFGFYNFVTIDKEGARFKESNRITKGTHKWLDVKKHTSVKSAVSDLKKKGFKIYCTSLESSVPIADIDFTQKTALVFGNEKEGVSSEMQELADGNCIIPMEGFAQSFNISVAAAISFYHVYLQRVQALGKNGNLSDDEMLNLKANYYIKSFGKIEKFKQLIIKLKEEK